MQLMNSIRPGSLTIMHFLKDLSWKLTCIELPLLHCDMQAPPFALVDKVFAEFADNYATIEPSRESLDFVVDACNLLAQFLPDEEVRQQKFLALLGARMGKQFYSVSMAQGVTATDGSIVDDIAGPEVDPLLLLPATFLPVDLNILICDFSMHNCMFYLQTS